MHKRQNIIALSKGLSIWTFCLFTYGDVGGVSGTILSILDAIAYPTSYTLSAGDSQFQRQLLHQVNSASLFSNQQPLYFSQSCPLIKIYFSDLNRYISPTVQWIFLGMELVRRRSPLWQQLATTNIHQNNMDKDTVMVMMAIMMIVMMIMMMMMMAMMMTGVAKACATTNSVPQV